MGLGIDAAALEGFVRNLGKTSTASADRSLDAGLKEVRMASDQLKLTPEPYRPTDAEIWPIPTPLSAWAQRVRKLEF